MRESERKKRRHEGGKKIIEGVKKSRVVHFCNVKSINTEAQNRLSRYSLLSIRLHLALFFILFFTLKTKRETWMQLFDVANSFHHQAIDRGYPESCQHKHVIACINTLLLRKLASD